MSRTPFDQFAKQFLEELLVPYGQVEISREIPGETHLIDLWFQPGKLLDQDLEVLGLLGIVIQSPCLLEPYRNPPSAAETNSCLLKRFWLVAEIYRQNTTVSLPLLWILTPTASSAFLETLGALPLANLPQGIYGTASLIGTRVIALHQLPETPDTLWLRLLGKGKVQQRAIVELLALSDSKIRLQALRLLVNWKIMLDTTNLFKTEEEETLMALSQAYLEWEQRTKEVGRQEGRQEILRKTLNNLFQVRFGQIDEDLQRFIQQVLQLSNEEYDRFFPQLLTLPRESLIQSLTEERADSESEEEIKPDV